MASAHFGGTSSILNVDDNEDGRTSLSWLLRDYGFDVWEAANGKEALQLAERKPDLVLLDVVLPDMNGFEVCQKIRANPATAATPVLMLSGLAVDTADRVHGLEDGADAYLTKPIEPDELLAHAKALLRARRAEDQLRRSQDLFRAFMDNSPAMAYIKGEDGRYLYANPRWEHQFSPARADWHGKADSDFWPRDVARQFREADAAALRSNKPVERVEALPSAAGQTRNLVTLRFPVWDAEGRKAVAGVALDVTERHRLEEQFRQAQKMEAVGRLAGGIAHDFNNLLTVINGYSELLMATMAKSDRNRILVEAILDAGNRATGLTRQLLTFSRKEPLQQRVLDLNGLVADMGRMLGRVIGEGTRLTMDLFPAPLMVKADAGQLEQVVMNLAINARDAMPTGGALVIRSGPLSYREPSPPIASDAPPKPYVHLSLTDTGHGMDKNVLARVWEPFFTTKPAEQGTGLGLATVYGIIKGHGGHVEAESDVGRGTTFHVFLPVVVGSHPAPESQGAKEGLPAGTETILLVEDEDGVRGLTRHVLTGLGYSVVEAASGEQAIEVMEGAEKKVHLLLTDVVMPGMGGREASERLMESHPGLKVLFMSGYTDDVVVRYGVQNEDVAFLQKPFSAAALAKKVRSVLDGTT